MKIALTGGTGFLGSHVYRELTNYPHTIVLFNKEKGSLFDRDHVMRFVKGADAVIHLAGANIDDPFGLYGLNTFGTVSLLEALRKSKSKARFLFASSAQVHHLKGPYAVSKYCAEEAIKQFATDYLIPSVILRIANIYGPGCQPFYNSVIATFVHQLLTGKKITINGDGSQMRDYIYAGDVATAFEKALTYPLTNPYEILDIGSGKSYNLKKVVSVLFKESGKKVPVVYNTSHSGGEEYKLPSNQKAMKALSWRPVVSLTAGIQLTLAYETQHTKTDHS